MFKSVTFYTNKLKALKRFYGDIMEFNVVESTNEQFIFEIGESTVTFKHTEHPAFYHFAINIPGNQFSMLKFWMQDRVTLNRGESLDEIYFSSFDADSMYFEDPAGNIVELIGRRKQDLFGDVSQASFLNISEVGIVTSFVASVGDQLQDFGIPLRGGTDVNPETLNFLGKGDAFIVLVPPSRKWYFSESMSEIHPLKIQLMDNRQILIDEEGELTLIH